MPNLSGSTPWAGPSPNGGGRPDLDGWRALGVAILAQAVADYESGAGRIGTDARQWLGSTGARWLVAALDLDPAAECKINEWIDALPGAAYQQAALWGQWTEQGAQ